MAIMTRERWPRPAPQLSLREQIILRKLHVSSEKPLPPLPDVAKSLSLKRQLFPVRENYILEDFPYEASFPLSEPQVRLNPLSKAPPSSPTAEITLEPPIRGPTPPVELPAIKDERPEKGQFQAERLKETDRSSHEILEPLRPTVEKLAAISRFSGSIRSQDVEPASKGFAKAGTLPDTRPPIPAPLQDDRGASGPPKIMEEVTVNEVTSRKLQMYTAKIRATNDPGVHCKVALAMIKTAQTLAATGSATRVENDLDAVKESKASKVSTRLLHEARRNLQSLADRGHPDAEYYLADGIATGLFHSQADSSTQALRLFVAASRHGHIEASYRAGLCYEFGWGISSDSRKAIRHYRQAAAKCHAGSMLRMGMACLTSDLGLVNRYPEGLKWLHRAADFADHQYNEAPYQLALLFEKGDGDEVFRDEYFAAQLYAQAAELGHADANFRLGEAHEHGRLTCEKNAALSIRYHAVAAQLGHPKAMMAMCAWLMLGAEGIIEKDVKQSYEWAKKAAAAGLSFQISGQSRGIPSAEKLYADCSVLGLPKAEYAVGHFTEMGIGCRRDPMAASVWYTRAADHGDVRAQRRVAAIKAAALSDRPGPTSSRRPKMP